MLSAQWFRVCPVFVLALGLMSCNKPESLSVDSFKIPEPTWESPDGDNKFNIVSLKNSERELGDRLSFADSPPATLIVRSRCVEENQVFTSQTLFSLPGKIPLFSMLPKELLA